MRAPRSVTRRADRHPLAELEARDRLARLAHLRALAAIVVSSSIAASSAFASVFASPTPMLSVIFSIFGTCMIDLRPVSWSRGRSSR